MTADQMAMTTEEDDPMEVMQAEETREEESTPPERVWDPSVKIIVIPGRGIVSDYRRTFIIVVAVYFGRVGLGLVLSILTRTAGYDSQTEFSGKALKRFQSFILSHRQLLCVSRGCYCILQLADNNRRHRIIRDPTIFRCNSDRS